MLSSQLVLSISSQYGIGGLALSVGQRQNRPMEQELARQIALILEHESERAFREAHDSDQSMLAQHSAKGVLQSGGTVKRAIKICSEIAHRVLDDLLASIGKVDKSQEAFDLLRQGFEAFLARLEQEELLYVARVSSGRGRKEPDANLWEATLREFAVHKVELARRLDLASFDFRSAPKMELEAVANDRNLKLRAKNKGGKPLAKHWDAMWAAMAVELWTGGLDPKSQADIKAAMFNWFNEAEIDVGDTALTQRARQLWQAMQDSDG